MKDSILLETLYYLDWRRIFLCQRIYIPNYDGIIKTYCKKSTLSAIIQYRRVFYPYSLDIIIKIYCINQDVVKRHNVKHAVSWKFSSD